MPIRVQNNLPAKKILEEENIFIMDENRALSQNIRPLEILILNLMPLKQDTEVQLLRSLSNTPLQVNISFLTTKSYVGTNTPLSHLDKFYMTIDQVRENRYDGMIITGAPVEQLDFEEVAYWEELKDIMEWSKTHITSTLHICWGAQAGIYYHYGVSKQRLSEKLSGVYEAKVLNRRIPFVRGFDDVFFMPHSRYTEISKEDILKQPELEILAESDEAGVCIVVSRDGRQAFVFGHPEYDRITLANEFNRDLDKGLNPKIPVNYYPNDDPSKRPLLRWRAHANTLYSNWLNYYVYQETPYLWTDESVDK